MLRLFWREEIKNHIAWYKGEQKQPYAPPYPKEDEKITDFELAENAMRTWLKLDRARYPKALKVDPDFFHGRKLLDVGCGPLPYLASFNDCELHGVDQLMDIYHEIGYPVDKFATENNIKYKTAPAEHLPYTNKSFDAVISINALDHVESFPAACKEIMRVLKPGGILRMQLHYHESKVGEPWALNDDLVHKHFAPLNLKKIADEAHPYDEGADERLTVWST